MEITSSASLELLRNSCIDWHAWGISLFLFLMWGITIFLMLKKERREK